MGSQTDTEWVLMRSSLCHFATDAFEAPADGFAAGVK